MAVMLLDIFLFLVYIYNIKKDIRLTVFFNIRAYGNNKKRWTVLNVHLFLLFSGSFADQSNL